MTPERFARLRRVLERRQPDLTVLMEHVNKTHNFSAILRNCDAVGILKAHAVMPEKGIDLHHHTSAGTTKWVEVQVHETVVAAIDHLHQAGFIVLAATLSAVGAVPVAGLALILGIDRFMSEARALTNIIGNGVATLVVGKWTGDLDSARMQQVLHAESPEQVS